VPNGVACRVTTPRGNRTFSWLDASGAAARAAIRTRAGSSGFIKAGFIKAGFIKAGFIKAGFIKAGFIKAGFIKAGFIKAGFIKAGFIKAKIRGLFMGVISFDSFGSSISFALGLIAFSCVADVAPRAQSRTPCRSQ
jgi:hypothetical protein